MKIIKQYITKRAFVSFYTSYHYIMHAEEEFGLSRRCNKWHQSLIRAAETLEDRWTKNLVVDFKEETWPQ